ncbi:complex I subunit 1/NuoH family protein [Marinoscillum pacificum]|uniref:complex I subunit 1/NuoH family protein n=1 Tax=Marinoscillum pacificum TaxID=392723 RepID=UPI00215771BF|nr:complex I subunit 1 family protein [Marinoscillum pacificum]
MITFLVFLPFLLGFVVIGVYGERKIAGFIQNRLGPMEVGPVGLFQTIADLLKMLQKEDIRPKAIDKILFLLAPIVVFGSIFAGYASLPLTTEIEGAGFSVGVFFLLSIVSIDVLGILMAGWGSNNKYSLYGAMRSAAQIVSYEIPLGLSVLAVVMFYQTLDLQTISASQGVLGNEPTYLFGIKSLEVTGVGGFLSWNVFTMPFMWVVFIIFFISSLAESNRVPFDLPESESELIGGYFTEYSGFRWGIFMLAEYAMMLLVSFLGAILFFGGWNTPLPNIGEFALADWTTGPIWGVVWLFSKATFFIFLQIVIRWTYPRLRVDQLMSLSWKYLTPAAILLLFIVGIWKLWMA